ncbi:alpha/beta fold hydrolase [Arsenicicoccus bolidensis]|uniref:Alpha/beta hydrolase n=1 Tax=Arsenicicoccus bolidensis TaxID=229480 RepID=A0ABS9Q5B6_9MICO|nr:alpha/beta hydrolase [Arsenicicoccus bolidensis]MCG7322974.1 alpha/beta hydrolase [Arsenicicoccus bolidensis]
METVMLPNPHVVRRGAGTPVLFIHGNGVDHRLLSDLDDVFASDDGDGWERIYVDLPGFGQTPPLIGRGGLPDVTDWLDELTSELIGSSSFAVVANSLGGLLARDLVARRPAQCLGMALLAPVVDPAHERRTVPERCVLVEDHDLLASIAPADAVTYAEMAVLQSRENWLRFQRAALPGITAADDDAMRRIGDLYELPHSNEDRLVLDRPVLVVAGKRDHIVGYEDQDALSRRFPRSTYAALDGAGHNVHLDQPELVRALLREWRSAVTTEAAIA